MNKVFDRVLIVMFENQYRSYVMSDPYMAKLVKAGADMTNYFGAFHPSQTNYVASLAGEVCAVTNDTPPAAPLPQQNMVDLLEAAGVSWKAYMEAYPNEPWNPIWASGSYGAADQPITQYPNNGTDLARYFRKHNAFASFKTIQSSKERWAKIVDEGQFWKDVIAGKSAPSAWPEYGWFTPDIWNDGHYLYNTHVDTNPRTELVPQLSAWLQYTFFGNLPADKAQGASTWGVDNVGLNLDADLLITNPKEAWKQSNVPPGTLIVITFDEADFDATGYDTNYDGQNQIYTVLLGDMIAPGSVFDTPYNHYSLMKTIQQNFGMGSLGKNDAAANPIRFLWNQEFAWSTVQEAALTTGNALAAACSGDDTYVLYRDATNTTANWITTLKADGTWTAPVASPSGDGPFALASSGGTIMGAFGTASSIQVATYDPTSGWSTPNTLVTNFSGALTLAGYTDTGDGQDKFMLCWTDATGLIHYQSYSGSAWGTAGSVGQYTNGNLELGQLGASLFLVYKERNTRQMRMTSYNLGAFNAFKAEAFTDTMDPENNTSQYAWSPGDFPVGNFAQKMNALQNQYQCRGAFALASIEGEMHMVHRAGYTDKKQAYSTFFGLTGIFTAESEWTNGYGTIDQAGWTAEKEMAQIQLATTDPMAMGSNGEQLFLIWKEDKTGTIKFMKGGYRTFGA